MAVLTQANKVFYCIWVLWTIYFRLNSRDQILVCDSTSTSTEILNIMYISYNRQVVTHSL